MVCMDLSMMGMCRTFAQMCKLTELMFYINNLGLTFLSMGHVHVEAYRLVHVGDCVQLFDDLVRTL